MSAFYFSLILCLIFCSWVGAVGTKSPFVSTLELGKPQYVSTSQDHVLCYEPEAEGDAFPLFDEILVYVKEVKAVKIPWYHIKGVSTDDLHAVLERVVYGILGSPYAEQHAKAPHEVESIIRDIASSCPNPLFSSNRSECIMRFSTIGRACVTIKATSTPLQIVVWAEKELNPMYLIKLVVGSLLVFVSGYLGYNILFQYTIGAVAFLFGGILILFMLVGNYLISARNQYATFVRSLFVALLLSGMYFTTLVYYLRAHWQQIVLHYWEYVLGYLVCSGVAGMVYMQVLRNDDKMKHSIAVAVKWALRIIGVVVVYNSSASPLGSVLLLSVLLVVYVVYSALKWGSADGSNATAEEKKQKKQQ